MASFGKPWQALASHGMPWHAMASLNGKKRLASIFSRMCMRRHRLPCLSSGFFRMVAASRMVPTRLLWHPVISAVHAPPCIKSVAGWAAVLMTAYGIHRFSSVFSLFFLSSSAGAAEPPCTIIIGISFRFIIDASFANKSISYRPPLFGRFFLVKKNLFWVYLNYIKCVYKCISKGLYYMVDRLSKAILVQFELYKRP